MIYQTRTVGTDDNIYVGIRITESMRVYVPLFKSLEQSLIWICCQNCKARECSNVVGISLCVCTYAVKKLTYSSIQRADSSLHPKMLKRNLREGLVLTPLGLDLVCKTFVTRWCYIRIELTKLQLHTEGLWKARGLMTLTVLNWVHVGKVVSRSAKDFSKPDFWRALDA